MLESELRRMLLTRDTVVEAAMGTSVGTGVAVYRHRMPLGLLMLSRKWITHDHLTAALKAQRQEGYGRLGEWLVAAGATDEARVAQAVAAQWGIPAVGAEEQGSDAVRLLPRLLIEAFDVVPLRIAGGKILYLAIDHQVDPCLNMAIEKMTGLRVEPVVLAARAFRRLQRQAISAAAPPARLFRATSVLGLRNAILEILGAEQVCNFELTRLREYFWLRVVRAGEASPVPFSSTHSPTKRSPVDETRFEASPPAFEDSILACADIAGLAESGQR